VADNVLGAMRRSGVLRCDLAADCSAQTVDTISVLAAQESRCQLLRVSTTSCCAHGRCLLSADCFQAMRVTPNHSFKPTPLRGAA